MILPGTGRGTGEAGGGGVPQIRRPEVYAARALRREMSLPEVMLVEIDGETHTRGDRPERDVQRDRYLNENGYGVLRIAAADVLRDVDGAVASILSCAAAPLHQPAAGPPPRAGED